MTTSEQQIFDEIRREHEHLRQLLGEVHQTLNGRCSSAGKLAEMMLSLQRHVQEHFDEEEEGGFFHEVVTQAPRMTDRAENLKSEHVDLAGTVTELVTMANDAEELSRTLDAKFHEFSKALMHHESKENDLLLDAYELDIGPSD